VLNPRFHWLVPAPVELDGATVEAARARGIAPRLLRVLARRGGVDVAGLAARFDPAETALHDPALLPDADRALHRIQQAVERSERVLVLGDFDADGLTGLAILILALRQLGVDAAPYVPARTEEGHGISITAIEQARTEGRTLLLTVDCGSTSVDEISHARAAGVDVIVTDHHTLGDRLPDAAALLNPKRLDSRYPDSRLSGSGVAFKVAQLILRDRPGGDEAALSMSDLAAIGSIADVVPLEGENRAIARLGLARLRESPRPGLAALLAAAGVRPERVDREAVSFNLAPRINAMGRVGHAMAAARLLLSSDPAEIAALTAEVESANDRRRELTAAALLEARERLDSVQSGIVVVAGDWPVGVIGLVAGRLAEELGRPAVVFSTGVSPWRGSARSAGGFDVVGAFASCGELFERYGGHAAAAGCHLDPTRFGAFRARMEEFQPLPVQPRAGLPTVTLDLVVRAESVDYVLLGELAPLAQSGDEPPTLGIAGLTVLRSRPAGTGHTQLTMRKGKDVLDGICFGRADLADLLRDGDQIDVVATLDSRTFAGLETLQLEVRDAAPAGHLSGLRRHTQAAAAVPSGLEPPGGGQTLTARV
jgi:single-stranded-DNA-specific exonuclease